MKKILKVIAVLAVVVGLAAPLVQSIDVGAATAAEQVKQGFDEVSAGENKNLPGSVKTIINIMLYIIGIVSVVMIIYGGIRFAASGGNEKSTETGRKTLTYAVIGLVVAILAYAIVNFVISGVGKPAASTLTTKSDCETNGYTWDDGGAGTCKE